MDKILKNQKYIFIFLSSSIFVVLLGWYQLYFKSLTLDYKSLSKQKTSIQSELNLNKRLSNKIVDLNANWEALNTDFESLIGKIPKKSSLDRISTDLFNLIKLNGLKIKDFTPSSRSIDSKNIVKPLTGEEIIIEKIPIDITVTGSFLDFGKLLDSMLDKYYQITTSDINITKEEGGLNQRIKFISYVYLYETTFIPEKKKERVLRDIPQKIKVEIQEPKKANRPIGAPDDIPDWMFEPITESVDTETKRINKTLPNSKEPIESLVSQSELKSFEQESISNVYHKMVVTDVKICKEVKNNSPLYTGTRFSTDIGRIHCYSSINNNSGKSNIIYHIWYMNGTLVAKVRIRVAKGEGVASFSNRDINSNDKGKWKVEITDSDKKILDTIIFELV
tara:strand:- start:195 stop:1370 length:1176 start_codon:yes stop_codon:yes gene_type:complete